MLRIACHARPKWDENLAGQPPDEGFAGKSGLFGDDGDHSVNDCAAANCQAISSQPVVEVCGVQPELQVVADLHVPFVALFLMKDIMNMDNVVLVIQEAGEYLLVAGTYRNKTVRTHWDVVHVIANRIDEFPAGI